MIGSLSTLNDWRVTLSLWGSTLVSTKLPYVAWRSGIIIDTPIIPLCSVVSFRLRWMRRLKSFLLYNSLLLWLRRCFWVHYTMSSFRVMASATNTLFIFILICRVSSWICSRALFLRSLCRMIIRLFDIFINPWAFFQLIKFLVCFNRPSTWATLP